MYIGNLSDCGKNLGRTNHSNADLSIQVQEEVLMNPGLFKQTSDPIKVIENGTHKTIDGYKTYYIDFEELVKPL